MKTLTIVLAIALLSPLADAHHGPGMRGYDQTKPVSISGQILKCFECKNSSKGHGVVVVQVESVVWEVTLPYTPGLRKLKMNLNDLKKGTAIQVTGFANSSQSKSHDMYADEITVKGVKVMSRSPERR